jgi:hypothetical protein
VAELDSALSGAEHGERLVLVVDQFEEVFTTSADPAEQEAFIGRLVELASDPAVAVAVTIRADYTGHCSLYPEFAELLAANLVLVGPMTGDQLRRAIELPARRVGLRVESALVDALVAEVQDEPGGFRCCPLPSCSSGRNAPTAGCATTPTFATGASEAPWRASPSRPTISSRSANGKPP